MIIIFSLLLFFFLLLRLFISLKKYKEEYSIYVKVQEYLLCSQVEQIGWYVSIASALMKCQQYANAYGYLSNAEEKFKKYLDNNTLLKKEISDNKKFCIRPSIIEKESLRNRKPTWLQYIKVYYFGNVHHNNISKETMSKVDNYFKTIQLNNI